ncbi:MAG: sodium:calcium antiporter [Ilumatobacter sp.]
MEIVLWVAAAVAGSIIVLRGSSLLESSAEHLSLHYGLPPVVHGAVVVAIGSSFPELSSTVLATLVHGEFELGLSVVIGSAIFNILVIPGLSGATAPNGMRVDKEVVYIDAQFYMLSVAVFVLVLALALIYGRDAIAEAGGAANSFSGEMTRPLALIPIALYCLYVFLQKMEVSDYDKPERPEGIAVGREWGRLVLSLVLVVAGVELLVRAALFMGDETGIPSFVWGITVIAAVTSVPDALISINLARKEEGVVSLSNVLGSNVFDLLVAVPVGVLIAGSVAFQFDIAMPLVVFLGIATVVLFIQIRTGLVLSKAESYVLLGMYAAFILWMILEQVDVMSIIPDELPDPAEAE